MTTPGSHNDAYASSYHRLFFQNRARGKPLHECASLWKDKASIAAASAAQAAGWPRLAGAWVSLE